MCSCHVWPTVWLPWLQHTRAKVQYKYINVQRCWRPPRVEGEEQRVAELPHPQAAAVANLLLSRCFHGNGCEVLPSCKVEWWYTRWGEGLGRKKQVVGGERKREGKTVRRSWCWRRKERCGGGERCWCWSSRNMSVSFVSMSLGHTGCSASNTTCRLLHTHTLTKAAFVPLFHGRQRLLEGYSWNCHTSIRSLAPLVL